MKKPWETRFSKYPLAAGERPKAMYQYYVTGRGVFPVDMLRYDSCWPASGEDAMKLLDRGVSVQLRSYREPTVERWSSFGWSVGTEKL